MDVAPKPIAEVASKDCYPVPFLKLMYRQMVDMLTTEASKVLRSLKG